MAGIIYINGKEFPFPKRGLNFTVTTAVDTVKNVNAQVVAQKVGRDRFKISSLVWPYLDAATWSEILREFSGFFAVVKFPDMAGNTWVTLKMYPGDRSAKPQWVDAEGMPTHYVDCKIDMIDCGV